MIVRQGVSLRADGTMYIGSKFLPVALLNRERFFKREGMSIVVSATLEHGSVVKVVTGGEVDDVVVGDGLVTHAPDVFLAITVADCFPVFFSCASQNIVGLAHAGWRGVASGIIENMVAVFKKEFDVDPSMIKATIGPGLRSCHFEIKEDVLQKFTGYEEFSNIRDGRIFLDLSGVIKSKLQKVGLIKENIGDDNECTFCFEEKYFSHRRDQVQPIEAMLVYIGVTRI